MTYHHFGLYAFVREDIERRLLDRMEGAVAAAGDEADRGLRWSRLPKALSRSRLALRSSRASSAPS